MIESLQTASLKISTPMEIIGRTSTGCGSSSQEIFMKQSTSKRGNLWTVYTQIITAVIGSGVLSLAWSVAQLGWIAGPLTMVVFAAVSLSSAFFLCACYKSPDPDQGPATNVSYLDAVRRILGERNAFVCIFVVGINFVKLGIVSTITSSISMSAIQRSNCYHNEGHNAACNFGTTRYILIFGSVQVIISQIVPKFQNTVLLSFVSATMSFIYSTIGLILGLAKTRENGVFKGRIGGVVASTAAEKVWAISLALGNIAFAFPFSVVFLEIRDTLRPNPFEDIAMKKASIMAVGTTTFFYLLCGAFGYAAFGNSTPGNLMTGFGFYEPFWLIDIANVCIVVNLVGGYQVFSQPLFANTEKWIAEKFPDCRILHKDYHPKGVPWLRLNILRLCFRTSYVILTTCLAILCRKHFNQVVGLAGAINFWPIVVHFPVEMYLKQKNIEAWTKKSVILRIYSSVIFIIMLYAFVGSIKGLVTKYA